VVYNSLKRYDIIHIKNRTQPMKQVRFEDSYILPSKVVCVGRNYVEHIYELGNEIPSSMVLFNKPNSAISDKLYTFYEDTRFEGEICFLIQQNGYLHKKYIVYHL